ncbi:apolipoprotein N-acyltransferase [Herminiimonas arsenitoxidans]|uniref:apolipoprotein N-acyltransferase n=1 Tax=Herminiimonas arsenitoxidans TaxID=1809410 RepID=UPI0009709E28|nr:apolipoprotein N-acyltransferase [Herminiimonas arsenitoxidans]
MNSLSSFRFTTTSAAIAALFAGALNVFAFAPFGFWQVQIIALALLFYLILQAPSVKSSVLTGWAYGFGWFGCCIYWLYISMHQYGGMPAPIAALAVILLAAFLGLLPALATGLAARFQRGRVIPSWIMLLLVLPALWMFSEWLRGWVFTGFPWAISGYAHTNSPLAGYAPLIGVYGVGWLAALLAACLVLLPNKKFAFPLFIVILAAGLGLKTVSWTTPNGQDISVRLLQGNVPQEIKFDAEQINATLTLYEDMIRAAPADLIATPETALPLLAHQLPADYLPRLAEFSTASNSHLVIGIPISDGPQQYANSVIGITPTPASGTAPKLYRYDKHHLVPFGEFIPLGFRWFVDMMHIPLGDFSRGDALQAPFAVKDQWVLPNICYEDLFGEEIAGQLRASDAAGAPVATLLLNVSNIAWFGDSIALPQHLQISQMRAIETGRPMLRATNTGATAIIGPDGKVLSQLKPFERGVLTASVQGYHGITPYVAIGNVFIVLLAFALLLAAWYLARRTPSSH